MTEEIKTSACGPAIPVELGRQRLAEFQFKGRSKTGEVIYSDKPKWGFRKVDAGGRPANRHARRRANGIHRG